MAEKTSILQILSEQPISQREICEKLHARPGDSDIYFELNKLRLSGIVERVRLDARHSPWGYLVREHVATTEKMRWPEV